ncbi:MAG: zf-HC2 domain-containing protein [Acidobacteriota bacterium]|nr:zf-HC2 domain-containing protein [Acidobacteriota bacterium]
MTCLSAQPMLEALLDGELDPNQKARILEHLETCASCSSEQQRLIKSSQDVRAQATYFRAPDSLRQKISRNLHPNTEVSPIAIRSSKVIASNWLAAAACIVIALSLSANLALLKSRNTANQLVAEEVFSCHMRSLLGTHLLDVPSSDRHTVKPWFAGKLDFSPEVKDLAAQGFPLEGGRVDYLGGRPVAALVFRRRQHVINLFTWPSSSQDNAVNSRQGYHSVKRTKAGMIYWAVSDLNSSELKQFLDLYMADARAAL